jgi:hypothetical protein
MLLTHLSLNYCRLYTQSPRSVSSSMLWLLDLRLKPSLSVPLSRASMCRPHQLPPLHHNPVPLDLGPCPAPPMPPLTLLSSIAQSRKPSKACCKWSTTHGASCKEVVVITSPPTHWPDKLVVGPLNSYLGSHGRAIRAITETWNYLRGLALVCDVLPVEADIQVMHAYFNAMAKRIREDNTTKMQVEVGSSKSFLHIPDFPYFGAKLTYDANSEPILVTPKQVKEILLASKWKDAIYLDQGAMPWLVRNSHKLDTCMVFFNIYNSRGGQHLHSLKGCSFTLIHITLTILPTEKLVGVPICPWRWRYGHCTMVCPFKTQLCAICAGPHQSDHHCVLGACCKAQPKEKPPWQATPAGHPCTHPVRCVNCGLDHSPNSSACSFWKRHYNPKWVHSKYTTQKVGDELLQFIPATNLPFPNVTGGRILRHQENPQEI